jgi:hypothetical protein
MFPVVDPIPIYLGGGIRRVKGASEHELVSTALHRIARLCSGWIPEGPPELINSGIKMIEQYAREYGRHGVAFDIRVATPFYLGSDKRAMEAVNRGLEHELVGSVSTIVRKVNVYREVGVHGMILRCWASDLESLVGMLRTFAKEVKPRFEAAS